MPGRSLKFVRSRQLGESQSGLESDSLRLHPTNQQELRAQVAALETITALTVTSPAAKVAMTADRHINDASWISTRQSKPW